MSKCMSLARSGPTKANQLTIKRPQLTEKHQVFTAYNLSRLILLDLFGLSKLMHVVGLRFVYELTFKS